MGKNKKSGSPLPIIIVLIIAAVAGSNFVGPKAGWITKVINSGREVPESEQGIQDQAPEEQVVSNDSQDKSQEIKRIVSTKKEEPKPSKKTVAAKPNNEGMGEIEKLHKKFIDEYLTKAKKPEVGKRYKVPTLTNAVRDGELENLDEYKIYLVKVKPYNAKTSIHYSVLPKKAQDYFFPEKAANSYANKKLEEYLKEQNKIAEIDEPEVASTGTMKKSTTSSRSSSFKKFDTTVTDSSKRLEHAALEVKNYLSNQSRLAKKRDGIEFAEITKCHAKQQGRASVFYMYVPKSFVATSQEYRFQIIDGVRRFWALRCMSNAVAVGSNSYLCVVYKDKVIGGSKLTDAENTWSK
ncbi:MAG: hypothetical protein NE330_13635 [Lentisphaeraceae bacterium]|nr:hypothetical protein [Lentisphaeraceae bacterium]